MRFVDIGSNPENSSKYDSAFQAAVDYGIDGSQLDYLLTLTPLERLIRHDQALELVAAMRQAGIRHYGFDPGLTEDPEHP